LRLVVFPALSRIREKAGITFTHWGVIPPQRLFQEQERARWLQWLTEQHSTI
jgi:hypothetical protein